MFVILKLKKFNTEQINIWFKFKLCFAVTTFGNNHNFRISMHHQDNEFWNKSRVYILYMTS